MEKVSEAELKAGGKQAPKSLRPCAADAYLLFQVLFTIVYQSRVKQKKICSLLDSIL